MEEDIIKPFESKEKKINWRAVAGVILIVALGITSGWGLVKLRAKRGTGGESVKLSLEKGEKVERGKTYGRTDQVFKDTATGVIQKNGIEGEGTHRLVREGGESQTAYLTSSVLDLDLFVGHKVQVWGETFAAQKAGWLMDAGKIKVLK